MFAAASSVRLSSWLSPHGLLDVYRDVHCERQCICQRQCIWTAVKLELLQTYCHLHLQARTSSLSQYCVRVWVRHWELLQGRKFERVFSGNGADEDIVVGSARAYVSALNKLISYQSASKQVSAGQEAGNGVPQQQQQVPA